MQNDNSSEAGHEKENETERETEKKEGSSLSSSTISSVDSEFDEFGLTPDDGASFEDFDVERFFVTAKKAQIWETHHDKYLIGEKIGQGSFGEIHEVLQMSTDKRLAAKVQQLRFRRGPGNKKEHPIARGARNEIRVLNFLSRPGNGHPNIIKLWDQLEVLSAHEHRLFLFMDYCVGSIEDMLKIDEQKRRSFPESQSNFYFKQLIHGLEFLHSRGILHLDIKPENLLLDYSGLCVKLCDFGVSQMLDEFNPKGIISTAKGSELFQPPEYHDLSQIKLDEPKYFGFKFDTWSAGFTLYTMLFGQYPFRRDVIEIFFRQAAECIYSVPETNAILEHLIRKILEKDPKTRYSIEEIKAHPWFKLEFVPANDWVKLPVKNNRDLNNSISCIPALHALYHPETVNRFVGKEVSEEVWNRINNPSPNISPSRGGYFKHKGLPQWQILSNPKRTSHPQNLDLFERNQADREDGPKAELGRIIGMQPRRFSK